MRLLGLIQGEKKASTFQIFLEKEGIATSFEPGKEDGTFAIWVHHEDEIEKALHWLEEFKKDPQDPRFQAQGHPLDQGPPPSKVPPLKISRRPFQRASRAAKLTRFIVLICALLYFWNGRQLSYLEEKESGARFFNLTPLFLHLSYDVPQTFGLLLDFFERHPVKTAQDFQTLITDSPEYKKIENTVSWIGIYPLLLQWPRQNQDLEAPLFIKLREGQVWRLFTPCLLHGGFLHILFNMLWLWMLGRQVEQRVKIWQYVLITLIIGVVSNTFQYLMSGPIFLGYSGVITGLAGFIWMRQKLAPWEGYPLQRGTLIFLMVFIFGMLILQTVSFFMVRFQAVNFPMNIANTAHISGFITGVILGRIRGIARGKI
jgi:GlpG protein